MTWCRYHCRRCGAHFTSLEGFDAHHEGSGENLIPCTFPGDEEFEEPAGTAIRPSPPEA